MQISVVVVLMHIFLLGGKQLKESCTLSLTFGFGVILNILDMAGNSGGCREQL